MAWLGLWGGSELGSGATPGWGEVWNGAVGWVRGVVGGGGRSRQRGRNPVVWRLCDVGEESCRAADCVVQGPGARSSGLSGLVWAGAVFVGAGGAWPVVRSGGLEVGGAATEPRAQSLLHGG